MELPQILLMMIPVTITILLLHIILSELMIVQVLGQAPMIHRLVVTPARLMPEAMTAPELLPELMIAPEALPELLPKAIIQPVLMTQLEERLTPLELIL